MRSVLVCLRTPLAAQVVANAAAHLGLSDVISTAVSGADALARFADTPADVLLVDTASVRPDTVGFTRRVLERSPEAVLVFFGPEDSVVARGAVEAGARGLIRGGEREDLVASVAKALMLLFRSARAPVPLQRSEAEQGSEAERGSEAEQRSGVERRSEVEPRLDAEDVETGEPGAGDAYAEHAHAGRAEDAAGATGAGHPTATTAGQPAAAAGVSVNGVRRLALTERELQVLRGMADGRSNAEIGRELFVSEDTVKTHARRLFRKLSARDRAHAVAAAFRAGLVR